MCKILPVVLRNFLATFLFLTPSLLLAADANQPNKISDADRLAVNEGLQERASLVGLACDHLFEPSLNPVSGQIDVPADSFIGLLNFLHKNGYEAQATYDPVDLANRLEVTIEQMGQSAFNALMGSVNEEMLREVYWLARYELLGPELHEIIKNNPIVMSFLHDLYFYYQMNAKTLWNVENAYQETLEGLKHVRSSAESKEYHNYTAESLATTISNTIDNVMLRAVDMYQDQEFLGETRSKRFFARLKRFVFPLYKRTKKVVDHSEVQQKQLRLIAIVDGIVREEAIDKAEDLGLDQGELRKLNEFMTDSPSQIKQVYDEVKRVFGEKFDPNSSVKPQNIDIYELWSKVKRMKLAAVFADYQREAELTMDIFDGILNDARKRKGEAPRSESDMNPYELQIRYAERFRKRNELRNAYANAINRRSRIRYTVEDRHTRQVPDGTDEDGNTKYRTETYYTDRTVYPTYSNILRGSYDTGDRFVSGLDRVKRLAADLKQRENTYRYPANGFQKWLDELRENYNTIVSDEAQIEVKIAEIDEHIRQAEMLLPELDRYRKWSEERIYAQFGYDRVEDFQARNDRQYARYLNFIAHFKNVREQLRRKQLTLGVPYRLNDHTEGLGVLRKYMYWNYGYKAVGTATPSGVGGYYYANPNVWAEHTTMLSDFVMRMLPFLQGPM